MNAPFSSAIGAKVLVTTDNWFFAPDGRQYKAVFGTLRAVRTAEDTLGVRPNGRSTNWYMEVGNLTIAGCQVHYALRSDHCSDAPEVAEFSIDPAHGCRTFLRPNSVYFADADAIKGTN